MDQLRIFLNRLIRGEDGLGHTFEVGVGRLYVDLGASLHGADSPVGHASHCAGLFTSELLPHASRAGGLDIDIVFGQAHFCQHAQQGVVTRVGVGQHGDRFAAQFARAVNALVLVADQLHQRARAQHRDRLHRNTLGSRND